ERAEVRAPIAHIARRDPRAERAKEAHDLEPHVAAADDADVQLAELAPERGPEGARGERSVADAPVRLREAAEQGERAGEDELGDRAPVDARRPADAHPGGLQRVEIEVVEA